MESVKRIEIVMPEFLVDDVVGTLGRHAVGAYTVLRGVAGRGERGEQDGRSGEATFSNAMIVVACPPARATALLEDLRPLLKRYGGVCLVSDAMSLRH
jgi:nitrogen regulatory protein PII